MDVAAWLARATADARARALPELEPLLQSLATSMTALRAADAEFGHPAGGCVAAEYAEHAEHKAADHQAAEYAEHAEHKAADHKAVDHAEEHADDEAR